MIKLNNQLSIIPFHSIYNDAISFYFEGNLLANFQTKPIPSNSIHSGLPKECNITS